MYHQEVSQQIETYNADLAYKTLEVSAFTEAAVYVEQDMPLKVEANQLHKYLTNFNRSMKLGPTVNVSYLGVICPLNTFQYLTPNTESDKESIVL